jgi:hypothetical protein
MYVSFGFMSNGVVYDYWDNMGGQETKFETSYTLLCGYRLASVKIVELKGGVGYFWAADLNGLTYELKLGIRLWQK